MYSSLLILDHLLTGPWASIWFGTIFAFASLHQARNHLFENDMHTTPKPLALMSLAKISSLTSTIDNTFEKGWAYWLLATTAIWQGN